MVGGGEGVRPGAGVSCRSLDVECRHCHEPNGVSRGVGRLGRDVFHWESSGVQRLNLSGFVVEIRGDGRPESDVLEAQSHEDGCSELDAPDVQNREVGSLG